MSKKVQKSVRGYFSKIKKQSQEACSKKWIASACKHPRALSFSIVPKDERPGSGSRGTDDRDEHRDVAATLSDIDQFLFENFKSLYSKHDRERSYDDLASVYTTKDGSTTAGSMFESPRLDMPQDLCGSSRFFVHPGFSSSLIEETRSSLDPYPSAAVAFSGSKSTATTRTNSTSVGNNYNTSNNKKHVHDHVNSEADTMKSLGDECVAILTQSRNPYDDFRRSMLEVVEARAQRNERVDWDFMEELLFCYLDLNDKKSSKHILSAFVDIIVVLRKSTQQKAAAPVRLSGRDRIGGGDRRKKRLEDGIVM